jgi:Ca-activated chloride channel homolog
MLRVKLPLSVVFFLMFAALLPASLRPAAHAAEANAAGAAPGELALLGRDGQVRGQCPLKHTDVTVDIAGFVSRVRVRQQFQNPAKEPLEAVYTFPLPNDAAVDEMTMTIADRVIVGEIKRREEARQIYETAKAAGQAAALLDQERPNIFTQSVANLMPGQDVTITISYVNVLKYDQGSYEFSFPMVVGPRYLGASAPPVRPIAAGGEEPPGPGAQPGSGPPAPVLTDPQRISPPITPQGTRAGHDISLSLTLDAGVPLQEIKSQLHPVVVEKDGPTKAKIRLQNQSTLPNQDFILRYAVAGDQMQTGLLAHSPGGQGGYFTLILQPPAAPPQKDVSPKEMVFVIDQTGSQRGVPIQKAKETLRYCIENLNPHDTFQLLGFNTQVYPCFSHPVPVTEENVTQALKFLEPLEGNGGTDILKSVDYALKIPDDLGRLRVICYMTDGYVGNDMQVIDHVRKHRGRARMFVFGVGNSVNRFLIDGMAKEGRGYAEYVDLNTPGEQIASKFYARIAKPLLLDPQVEWNGLPVEDVYPRHIPDVFSAGPIILKGRYTKAAQGDLMVKGLLRGQPWSQTVPVTFPEKQPEGAALPTLWAREKIEDLQAQDWMGAQSGSPDPKIKEQIVNLALDYRLMTQHTSFVAVEQRVVNIGGKQRTVQVPVEMPVGVSYEGIFGDRAGLEQLGLGVQAGQSLDVFGRPPRGTDGTALGGRVRLSTPAPGPVTAEKQPASGPPQQPAAPSERPASAPRKDNKPASPAPASAAPQAAGTVTEKNRQLPVSRRAKGEADSAALEERKKAALKALGEMPAEKAAGELSVMTSEEQRILLAAMRPAQRRALLAALRLAPSLRGLSDTVRKEGSKGTLHKPGLPEVDRGRVAVQVWVDAPPRDGLKKLKARGFGFITELRPKQLWLGTVPVDRLELLADLPFVRLIEPPRFK